MQKHIRVIVSIFSVNWIKQYYWYIKTLKAFFCVESFFNFVLYISSLLFFYYISQIVIYLPKFFSSVIKYIRLVLSEYYLYILISGKNMHKGLSFYYLCKVLFTKRKLIRYYYFINIYIIHQNRAFILNLYSSISVSSNFIIFLSIFIYGYIFFFNL